MCGRCLQNSGVSSGPWASRKAYTGREKNRVDIGAVEDRDLSGGLSLAVASATKQTIEVQPATGGLVKRIVG
jgi:hypothetical protein